MNRTSIEWTHRPETGGAKGGFTWNPIRARRIDIHQDDHETKATGTFCTRISPGCTNCYASVINKRFGTGLEYTVPNLEKHNFYLDERILLEPLKRKKPATIFVGDMFDLFHEAIPDEMIDEVFSVMWFSPQHTFQVLTKRAERMQRWFTTSSVEWVNEQTGEKEPGVRKDSILGNAQRLVTDKQIFDAQDEWPPRNIWLGVSVESQKYADERIPLLLQTPAAVRFLSVEPLLESVDLTQVDCGGQHPLEGGWPDERDISLESNDLNTACRNLRNGVSRIDWVIVGGESGPGAHQFNPTWAGKLLGQCRNAGVPFFMKQFGSNCYWRDSDAPHDPLKYSLATPLLRDRAAIALGKELENWHRVKFKDRKGGDPSEWPEEIRVREFPR